MRFPNIFEKDVPAEAYTAGTVIFEAGQPGTAMYVIKDGEVEIRSADRVIETLGADSIFGEMALIDSEPRSARAIARTDCTLVPIDQKRFLFMVHETPFFALEVLRVMSARLRRQNLQSE